MNHRKFSELILAWGKQTHRPMPWKGEKNPYFIWLSEIILQQTRVEQGRHYYLKFKKHYPTIQDLANAEEDAVLKDWEGLGYYSRARNLHFTAKYISKELQGIFPNNLDGLLKLKGVGAYTASAIASFAFNIPKAVVDGNVIRVLSRVYGIENQHKTAQEKREFQEFADLLISQKNPAIYNQAIMDFGAQVCLPKKYLCDNCMFSKECVAFKNKLQDLLPLKKTKIKTKKRAFTFLVFNYKKNIYIEKRIAKDIWKGLYQFPLLENGKIETKNEILKEIEKVFSIKSKEIIIKNISNKVVQKLTHQTLIVKFVEIELKKEFLWDFIKTDIKILHKFAFPKIIKEYILETK